VLKLEKKDAEALILEMREVGERVNDFDNELRTVEEYLERLMLSLPNIPHESAPVGETEDDNVVARTLGDVKEFTFYPKPHWDIATDL
ncbi:serine--tRNA ligase, partial [Bacillus thuringiensis]|nr:serine--tRNA ligase [Bacillus thuringiensis]